MSLTTIYRPNGNVQSIETQDELNDLLRANQIESILVNNDSETLARYADAYYVHTITDLIGFDKKQILKAEKAKKSKDIPSDEAPSQPEQEAQAV